MTRNVIVAVFVFALAVLAYMPVGDLVDVVSDANSFAERSQQHRAGFWGC
jgi:hypothetical protein